MRNFTVSWRVGATVAMLRARAYLGAARAADLDAEIEDVIQRLARLPESGHPVEVRRGEWDLKIRKVLLSHSPYHLYYVLDLARETVIITSLRHERARPLRKL